MAETQMGDAGRRSMWDMVKSCSGTERDRQNQYRFVAWLFASAIDQLISMRRYQ